MGSSLYSPFALYISDLEMKKPLSRNTNRRRQNKPSKEPALSSSKDQDHSVKTEYFSMTTTLLQANFTEKVVTVLMPMPAKIKWGGWTLTFPVLYKVTSILLLKWCQESSSRESAFDPHQPVKKTPQPTQRPYGMSEHPF